MRKRRTTSRSAEVVGLPGGRLNASSHLYGGMTENEALGKGPVELKG